MESSPQFRVAKHVQDLVQSHLPAGVSDSTIQRYVQYCMRILSSRITPLDDPADSDHIKTLLLKKIQQKPKPAKGTLHQETVRFEELCARLQRTKSLTKRTQMLHLLLQLSGSDSAGKDAGQGPVVESVFATKLAKQVSYKADAKKQNQVMKDQSNAADANANNNSGAQSSTRQRQLDYLRTLRFSSPNGEVNEDVIVRELLFVFQGIDGQLIKYQLLEDAYVLQPTITVSPSTHKLISELCELGWLYKKVNDWVSRNGGDSSNSGGVNQVTQSLCFAVQAELTEYYRLLAVLESQRNMFDSSSAANYLNLRKLYLWIQEPLERMKWLAVITDSVNNLKGGAICSVINTFGVNGSPATKQFISRILKEVSVPILTMIKSWMLEGEINDPFCEFFVETDPQVGDQKLWTEKYRLNYIMIPAYLSNSLANKILQTGKAVNFIRRCCNEQDWILDVSLQTPFQNESDLNLNRLQQWVNDSHLKTNKQLLNFLFSKYQLEGHCNSIRKYLLMGQGDLMEYLMDLLADELQNPASQIYKHTLRAYLDTAIRSSNAQFHAPEFLGRLDVKLLESQQGDRGWEIFQLDYKVSDLAPLSTIFSEEIMANYLKIFSFMWKLKKIQHQLSLSWGLTMTHRKQFTLITGPLQSKFHKFNLAHHEMAHFVTNVHNYILVEVLESAWTVFTDQLRQVQDLDSLILMQKKFVSDILDKALLSESQRDLYRLLQKLLNNVFMFTLIKEKYFYQSAIQESERLERVNRARSLGQEVPEEDLQCQINYHSIEQIENIHADFFTQFQKFKEYLQTQNQTNLKYLLCRLDFNEFYQRKEEESKNVGHDSQDDSQMYGDEDEDDDQDEEDDVGDEVGESQDEGEEEEEEEELDEYDDEEEDEHIDQSQQRAPQQQHQQFSQLASGVDLKNDFYGNSGSSFQGGQSKLSGVGGRLSPNASLRNPTNTQGNNNSNSFQ